MNRVVYVGTAPHRIQAEVICCGMDHSVIFNGGTKDHIGAVAVGYFDPQDQIPVVRVQSFGLPGHRELELVQEAAKRLAFKYCSTVHVSAGIHVDKATEEDIRILCENFYRCLDLI